MRVGFGLGVGLWPFFFAVITTSPVLGSVKTLTQTLMEHWSAAQVTGAEKEKIKAVRNIATENRFTSES
jgi:hypothetical protein